MRNSGGSQTEVGRLTATAGQTDFNVAFPSSGPGSAGEFFAFVVTKLLPLDLLQLEVGNAVSLSGVQTSAGGEHTCALLADGTARCWGRGGRLGSGTTTNASTPQPVSGLATAVALRAGAGHTCALLVDGRPEGRVEGSPGSDPTAAYSRRSRPQGG